METQDKATLRGDILLTKVGTTGIAVAVETDAQFSVFVSLALLKVPQDWIDVPFLTLALNSLRVKMQSERGTQGVGNKNLVLKFMRDFTIPLPPLAEQKRIVAKVNELFVRCDALEAKLTQSRADADALAAALVHRAAGDDCPGRCGIASTTGAANGVEL